MKNLLTYTLITLTLTSCLELLDDVPQSFERVYGSEGTSVVRGMIKRDNGNLLLFGEEVKPAFKDGADVSMPFILETDEFGNEVKNRNYGFFKGKFDISLTIWDEVDPGWYGTNEFESSRARILDLIELSNGNFFSYGSFPFRPKNTWWPADWSETNFFYLLLDKNLEPIKWGFFNDTELEGPERFWHYVRGTVDILELPTGEIIIPTHYYDFDISNKFAGFAIYKFSIEGDIIDIRKYPERTKEVTSSVLDPNGSSLVVTVNSDSLGVGPLGSGFSRIAFTSQLAIDIFSGEILSRGDNMLGISYNISLADNGYVARVYHPAPDDSFGPGDREWWGSLLFLDKNLKSTGPVNITETNDILRGNWSFIRTTDGGYVTEFQKNLANGQKTVLIKTDKDGKPLWHHETENNSSITGIVEMDDGGIAYVIMRDYNGIGKRVTLVKLTPDGKL